MFHAKIVITLRRSILDPQGKAVEHGIHSLGYPNVRHVRIGKHIELDIDTDGREDAERIVRETCEKLLANPVMEDASFTIEKTGSTTHVEA